MLILVTYDVSTETSEGRRRLRNVARVCEDYGQRVQKSVFECQVAKTQLHSLTTELVQTIDPKTDSLRFYRIREPWRDSIETYGIDRAVDFEEPLIV